MNQKIHNFCFKAAGIFLVLLLLVSCKNSNRKYVLPEKKFIAFLVDLHLAEAIGGQSKRDVEMIYKIDSVSLYGSVFRKHGVSRAMFDSTLFFYSLRPEKFQKIYNTVTVELKHREEETLTEQRELEMAESEILWQSDTVYVFPKRRTDKIFIDVPIRGPGIYTVTANVKMIADDASMDPRMSLFFYRDDSTGVGVKDYFNEIRYLSRDGQSKLYRSVRNLENSEFTHLRGYIANYSNRDTAFRRNMVVQDIMVTKRPLKK